MVGTGEADKRSGIMTPCKVCGKICAVPNLIPGWKWMCTDCLLLKIYSPSWFDLIALVTEATNEHLPIDRR